MSNPNAQETPAMRDWHEMLKRKRTDYLLYHFAITLCDEHYEGRFDGVDPNCIRTARASPSEPCEVCFNAWIHKYNLA